MIKYLLDDIWFYDQLTPLSLEDCLKYRSHTFPLGRNENKASQEIPESCCLNVVTPQGPAARKPLNAKPGKNSCFSRWKELSQPAYFDERKRLKVIKLKM